MPYIEIDDRRLHYQLDGPAAAPVLVLSNSLGTTLEMWQPQLEAFSRHFRVLRYDTRGHGGSSLGKGACTLTQLGQDVVRLLDALDIERAHFCGISMGGLTGQWLGIHAPQRMRRLVVCNTAARIGTATGWLDRASLVRRDGMNEVANGAAARWFTPGFIQQQPALVGRMIEQLRQGDAAGYAACCDALAVADLRRELKTIAVPMLVVAGAYDPVTTPVDADFIAGQVPGALRLDLPASHLSSIEDAHGFNPAIIRFLQAESGSC